MRRTSCSSMVVGAVLLIGCGGGGGDGGTDPTPTPAAIALSISDASPMTAFGQTRTITAVVRDQNNQTMANPQVQWSTSSSTIAALVGNGVTATVTAQGNGTATITARAGTINQTIGVSIAQAVASVLLSPGDTTIYVTGTPNTVQYTAQARDANGNTVAGAPAPTFASSNTGAATVNASSGVVTAVAPGTTNISATIGSQTSGTRRVTVQQSQSFPNSAVVTTPGTAFNPSRVDIAANGTVRWDISGLPHSVIWTSNAPPGGNIGQTSDASVSRTFTTAGTYDYTCGVHGASMSGTVVVH